MIAAGSGRGVMPTALQLAAHPSGMVASQRQIRKAGQQKPVPHQTQWPGLPQPSGRKRLPNAFALADGT